MEITSQITERRGKSENTKQQKGKTHRLHHLVAPEWQKYKHSFALKPPECILHANVIPGNFASNPLNMEFT